MVSYSEILSSLGEPLLILDNLAVPPTLNKSYVSVGKRRILSSAARTFKEAVKASVVKQVALRSDLSALNLVPLMLCLEVYFESLVNKGWSSGKAKSCYKQVDISNRIKLAEDALCSALGIDDRQFFPVLVGKHQGLPRMRAMLFKCSLSVHGVTDVGGTGDK